MSVTAKTLIDAKYAANATNTEYTCPADTTALIDKFTATNIDGSTRTLSVYIVPNGSSPGNSNLIIKTLSISAGATDDITELKNHILEEGDTISCVASAASNIVIRASGREVT